MTLNNTFRFRNQWIGLAMLWIMWFHSGLSVDITILRYLKRIGYGGVDICLFASGIGCYFSLEKDPDILRFLKRRIKRLGPTYLCFIIPWLCWRQMEMEMPWNAVLGNLLGIQTLVSWQYHFNWYIGGLVVFYICLPYLKRLTDFCETPWKDFLVWVCLAIVGIPFWNDGGNDIVILSRLPILYAGVVCAKMAKQGKVLTKMDYLLMLLATAMGAVSLFAFNRYMPDLLWLCGLHWYPFALIVPGICIALAVLMERFQHLNLFRFVNRILEIIGRYSFEVYLTHVFLYEGLMPQIMSRGWNTSRNMMWLLTLPVVAGGSYLLNRAAAVVNWLLKTKDKRIKA